MEKIKQLFSILMIATTISSCNHSSSNNNDKAILSDTLKTDSTATSVKSEPVTSQNLYQEIDSIFNINGKKFKVNVKQYDITELESSKGDTLSRPVYVIALRIFDGSDKLLLKDSLDRDSWGYPGKIKRIDAYQISFPQLTNAGNEIIAAFNIWEDSSRDMISGRVAYDITSNKPRYFWEEAFMEE